MNRLVAVVLKDDHRDLQPLLNRGDQFRGAHQVGPVADDGVDLPVGTAHPKAKSGRNLVAHAGEADLHERRRSRRAVPQLVDVYVRRSGSHDQRVLDGGGLIEHLQRLGLAELLPFSWCEIATEVAAPGVIGLLHAFEAMRPCPPRRRGADR